MPKATNQPKSPHTEDTMRLALSRLASVRQHLTLLRDDDDPVAVLEGVIDELLHKRQSIAGVTSFMQQYLAENVRR